MLKTTFLRSLLALACAGVLAGSTAFAQTLASPPLAKNREEFSTTVLQPFLKEHCLACHSGERAKAKVRLDDLTKIQDRRTLAKVFHQISDRTMPPEDKTQPPPEQLQRVVAGLKELLDDESALPARPTPTAAVRRLNRKQYRNAIHDLFGIDYDPTALMPADEIGHGFDNMVGVLVCDRGKSVGIVLRALRTLFIPLAPRTITASCLCGAPR